MEATIEDVLDCVEATIDVALDPIGTAPKLLSCDCNDAASGFPGKMIPGRCTIPSESTPKKS